MAATHSLAKLLLLEEETVVMFKWWWGSRGTGESAPAEPHPVLSADLSPVSEMVPHREGVPTSDTNCKLTPNLEVINGPLTLCPDRHTQGYRESTHSSQTERS